jgi:AAA domain, putative AbiEii toxin, Type IV TA system
LSNEKQPRLLSFALDGWDVLGGRVSVSLSDRVAVLVGRNGAGKSAILEGFEAIASLAVGRLGRNQLNDTENFPKVLGIEILTPNQRRLKYQYELIPLTTSIEDSDIDESTNENDNSEENQFSWNDCCQYLDEQEEEIWTTELGITKFDQEENPIITILGSTNPFGRSRLPDNTFKLPREMKWVYNVLKEVKIIGKLPVRRNSKRRQSLILQRDDNKIHVPGGFSLADSLAFKILRLMEDRDLDELENICRRVGIGDRITVQKFILSENSKDSNKRYSFPPDEGYISSVLLDGVNVGLLSDGTIRVLSILIEIISSSASPLKIIEEPEMQIHPGMLEKLLNEIEAYTLGENLILSTHSPQVVSWAKPDKINLIYRDDTKISVRKLSAGEIDRVAGYLNNDGDLGDWIYSGILDD